MSSKSNKIRRARLYEWCQKNATKIGKEKEFKITHYDYCQVRTNLFKTYPYAGYEILKNEGDVKHLKIFIAK